MNTQHLEAINGLEISESSELYAFEYEECVCDNVNDNPGTGW